MIVTGGDDVEEVGTATDPKEPTIDDNYLQEQINKALEENNKTLEERFKSLQEQNKQLQEDKRRYELIKLLDENKLPLSCVDLLNVNDDPEVITSKIAVINSILQDGIKRGRDERINHNRYVPPAAGGHFKNKNNTNKSFYNAFVGE